MLQSRKCPKSAHPRIHPKSCVMLGWWCIVLLCHLLTDKVSVLAQSDGGESSERAIMMYGMNYNIRRGPDWDPNRCETLDVVVRDLKLLSQVTSSIRILSLLDCNQAEVVLNGMSQAGAEVEDMTLWLGLWVSNDTQVLDDELAKLESMLSGGILPSSRVVGITVGSEAIYREEATAAQMIENYQLVKDLLNSYSYDIPVSIVDVDTVYNMYPELYSAVDQVVFNAFPFWEGVPVETAASYLVDSKISIVRNAALAAGKDYIIGETGWPSEGNDPRASAATPSNQAKYFQDFYCLYDQQNQLPYYYFTAFDPEWRISQDNQTDSVEGHFGLFSANRTLKQQFVDLTFTCPTSSNPNVVHKFVVSGSDNLPPQSAPDSTPSAPVTVSSPSPTDIMLVTTNSPMTVSSALCSDHSSCAGLFGNCCPTDTGETLACCSSSTWIVLKTSSPIAVDTSSPTSNPIDSPTSSPTYFPTNPVPVPLSLPTDLLPSAGPSGSLAPGDGTTIMSDPPSDIPSDETTIESSNDGSFQASDTPTTSPTIGIVFTTRNEPTQIPVNGIESGTSDAVAMTFHFIPSSIIALVSTMLFLLSY